MTDELGKPDAPARPEDEERRQRVNWINNTIESYGNMYNVLGESLDKYLFLVNAGGAIATLSFIGAIVARGGQDIVTGAEVTLMLFVVGLLLTGVERFINYQTMGSRMLDLHKNAMKFFGDAFPTDTKFDSLIKDALEREVNRGNWTLALGLSSFGCFIGGCYFGAVTFDLI